MSIVGVQERMMGVEFVSYIFSSFFKSQKFVESNTTTEKDFFYASSLFFFNVGVYKYELGSRKH